MKINESPYDKKINDLHRQMNSIDKSPSSKIPSKSSYSNSIDINGKNYDLKQEAWKSASDVAQSIGASKIFAAKCDYYYEGSMSDHEWSGSDAFTMCFYATDKAEAEDMLKCFSQQHNWTGRSLNLHHTPFGTYTFSDLKEISQSEANAIISNNQTSHHEDSHKELINHILYLPTTKILDEMKKSIDWAMNVLSRMKNTENRRLREIWIQTPEGKAWKELYDKEQVLLKKLDIWNKKKQQKQEERDQVEEQRKQNVADIVECFDGKSSKYPQFNGHFIPVIVSGGKKFQGKGYLTAIEYKEASFSYYESSEWDEAMIFCPLESKKFNSANLKYCKIDDTVDASTLAQMKEAFYEEKVESTKAWCRRKDPSKSEGEISKWAANIIKKYIPEIDTQKYFGIADINAEKAKSTAEWACNLPDVSNVKKAEQIIFRALSKKAIDAMKYKDVIAPIVVKKFGKTESFK